MVANAVTQVDSLSTPLAYALAYAKLGWKILPIEPATKRPHRLAARGVHSATGDAAEISEIWRQAPDAGIAVSCLESGLVVLDIDPRNGGLLTLERLESTYGPITSDVQAITPGGGLHLFFSATGLVGRLPGTLGPGIDVKARGYVCVEPSLHPTGRQYVWEASCNPLESARPSPLPALFNDYVAPHAGPAPDSVHAPVSVNEQTWTDIYSALRNIPSDDRDTWLRVGMALHSTGDTERAYAIWGEWSQRSPKYDPRDQMRVWRSFRARGLDGITYRTIFAMSKPTRLPDGRPDDGHAEPTPPAPVLVPIDLAGLSLRTAEPPRFIVPGWLPARAVTLFSSHGSAGKSQIAIVLGVCLSAGIPWMGIPVERRRVLFYSCEDDRAALEFRLQQACAALDVDMRQLAGWLHLIDATEADNIMYTDDRDPSKRLTATYGAVAQYVQQHRIEFAIIDNASDVYAANEIARASVKDFISKLKRISTINDGSVLLLGHASKEATKSPSPGQMYSGSTAWHNSVRSRWELTVEKRKDDPQEDGLHEEDDAGPPPDAGRILTCVKSNYGSEGHSHVWRWNYNHLILMPDTPRSPLEESIIRRANDAAVLRAVAWCNEEKIRVTTNRKGSTNFTTALRQSPVRLAGVPIADALGRLVADGLIEKVPYRKSNRDQGLHYLVTKAGLEVLKK